MLVSFLQQLKGQIVTIELKNATIIEGEIVGVDHNMNTHVKKVKITVKGKNRVELDQLTVRGATIRYYILPNNLPIDKMLSNCN